MKEFIIDSTLSFHENIEKLKSVSTSTIFRGLSNCEYKLIPSIGRIDIPPKNLAREIIEKRLFLKFKESAIAYIERVPQNDFEWLALAQHYGLPTSVL